MSRRCAVSSFLVAALLLAPSPPCLCLPCALSTPCHPTLILPYSPSHLLPSVQRCVSRSPLAAPPPLAPPGVGLALRGLGSTPRHVVSGSEWSDPLYRPTRTSAKTDGQALLSWTRESTVRQRRCTAGSSGGEFALAATFAPVSSPSAPAHAREGSRSSHPLCRPQRTIHSPSPSLTAETQTLAVGISRPHLDSSRPNFHHEHAQQSRKVGAGAPCARVPAASGRPNDDSRGAARAQRRRSRAREGLVDGPVRVQERLRRVLPRVLVPLHRLRAVQVALRLAAVHGPPSAEGAGR